MGREQLARLGVEVGTERVVTDRNRITGGGVTAGIDFGLVIAGMLCGEETAKITELLMEYDPAPPFNVGSPEKAGADLVSKAMPFYFNWLKATKPELAELYAKAFGVAAK
jgi:cyclohexyl-isocyanide hydratase